MRTNIKTMSLAALASMSLTAGSAWAQAYTEWDSNQDGALSQSEFKAGLSERNVFSNWDRNQDAELDEAELSDGVFAGFDNDATGTIDDNEMTDYSAGMGDDGLWGGEEYGADFEAWDIDGDGIVAREEFGNGFVNRRGELAAWDADESGELSKTELIDGLFRQYDDDGNQLIEEPELGDVGDDLGDGGFWDV